MLRAAILGAGWTGLTLAWCLTHRQRADVTLIERAAPGGMSADLRTLDGRILPLYGAHIFHTRSPVAWGFVQRFSAWNAYRHEIRVRWGEQLYDYPISLAAVQQVYGRALDMAAAIALLHEEGAPWREQAGHDFESAMLAQLGPKLYELYCAPYTRKMWGRPPHALAARLAGRVPLRLTDAIGRFDEPYQGLPMDGYAALFQALLADCPGLSVVHADYREMSLDGYDHLFVTTPLDEWYGYDLGRLEWRGLGFETHASGLGLPVGTVNTNDHPTVLRIEDPAHYYGQTGRPGPRPLVYNYPADEPRFYPVPTARNDALAARYRARADTETRVSCVGRLGRYRYIEQDQAILMALHEYERLTDDPVSRDLAVGAVPAD